MSCSDNLPKCRSVCCKYVLVKLAAGLHAKHTDFTIDMPVSGLTDYFVYHGFYINQTGRVKVNSTYRSRCVCLDRSNRLWLLYLPCSKLTSSGTCSVHDTPAKPDICINGYTCPSLAKSIVWFKSCKYIRSRPANTYLFDK